MGAASLLAVGSLAAAHLRHPLAGVGPPPSVGEQPLAGQRGDTARDAVLVVVDWDYRDLAFNSALSFARVEKEADVLVVGLDAATVQFCKSLVSSGSEQISQRIKVLAVDEVQPGLGSSLRDPLGVDPVTRVRCLRMQLVDALLRQGRSVFLIDSDIVATSAFDLNFLRKLPHDLIVGLGTFPELYNRKWGFALQSGIYYAKPTAAVLKVFEWIMTEGCPVIRDDGKTSRWRQGICFSGGSFDDQWCWNAAVDQVLLHGGPWSTVRPGKRATSLLQAAARPPGLGLVKVGVLPTELFPTGCRLWSTPPAAAWLRHPHCIPRSSVQSTRERVLQKVCSLKLQDGWMSGAPNGGVEDVIALLVSFPGSGNTMTRYALEQLAHKRTISTTFDARLVGTLEGEGRSCGWVVKVHPHSGFQPSHSLRSIVLVRNPFDAIWAWYNLAQTGSHIHRILKSDFSPPRFREVVLGWAVHFNRSAFEEMWPRVLRGNLLVKMEDLIAHPNRELRRMLRHLGEPELPATPPLRIPSHPAIARVAATPNDMRKEDAYSLALLEEMWAIFRPAAELFGYSKPLPPPAAAAAQVVDPVRGDATTQQSGSARTKQYLSYQPNGGTFNQLFQLKTAVQMARTAGRTLILPPVLSTSMPIFAAWRDAPTAPRTCTAELANTPTVDFAGSPHIPLESLIETGKLGVATIAHDEALALLPRLTKLSLAWSHRCNTRWSFPQKVFNYSAARRVPPRAQYALCRAEPEWSRQCYPYFEATDPANRPTSQYIAVRSMCCLVNPTSYVDVLQFGTLPFTTRDGAFFPGFKPTAPIHSAAAEAMRRIRSWSGGYHCVQLRLSGSEWEQERSPFIPRRAATLARGLSFVKTLPADGAPVYVCTDNIKIAQTFLSKHEPSRRFVYGSEFQELKATLPYPQQVALFDAIVCSGALEVSVSNGSSLGAYVWFKHHRNHVEKSGQSRPGEQPQPAAQQPNNVARGA